MTGLMPDIEIKITEAVFTSKNKKKIVVPIGSAEIKDEEIILEKRFATPIVEHDGNKTTVIDGIGKFKDGSIIMTGKVVEKLDKPVEG